MGFSMLGAMGGYMAEKPREIVKIDLDDLLDDKNNDFEVEGGTGIEKKNALLKDSIEQFGLLEPCTVRPAGGGKYTLISGHRRKLMHRRLVEEGKTEFQRWTALYAKRTTTTRTNAGGSQHTEPRHKRLGKGPRRGTSQRRI